MPSVETAAPASLAFGAMSDFFDADDIDVPEPESGWAQANALDLQWKRKRKRRRLPSNDLFYMLFLALLLGASAAFYLYAHQVASRPMIDAANQATVQYQDGSLERDLLITAKAMDSWISTRSGRVPLQFTASSTAPVEIAGQVIRPTEGIVVMSKAGDEGGYCLSARHPRVRETKFYDSQGGGLLNGAPGTGGACKSALTPAAE